MPNFKTFCRYRDQSFSKINRLIQGWLSPTFPETLSYSIFHTGIEKAVKNPDGFLIKWRPQGDLNPCCRRERAATPPYPAWICNDFSSNRVNRSIRVIAFCVRFCVRFSQTVVQSIAYSTPQKNQSLYYLALCSSQLHATLKLKCTADKKQRKYPEHPQNSKKFHQKKIMPTWQMNPSYLNCRFSKIIHSN